MSASMGCSPPPPPRDFPSVNIQAQKQVIFRANHLVFGLFFPFVACTVRSISQLFIPNSNNKKDFFFFFFFLFFFLFFRVAQDRMPDSPPLSGFCCAGKDKYSARRHSPPPPPPPKSCYRTPMSISNISPSIFQIRTFVIFTLRQNI